MFVPETLSRPPPGVSIPQTEQLVCTVLTHIPFAFLLYKAAVNILQRGDPTCLLFAIGGVVASAMEPIVDVMGFCFFPREGSWIAFETHNRPIPYFVPGTYGWFVGGLSYWVLTTFEQNKTVRSDIWRMWLRNFGFNLILEYTALYLGIYVYYGHQPFAIGGFPLWFPACHAICPLMAATTIHLIRPHLKGWKFLTVPLIVSASYGMANAGFGWPVWIALSLDSGLLVSYPAGVLTFIFIATALWVMSLAFPEEQEKLKR